MRSKYELATASVLVLAIFSVVADGKATGRKDKQLLFVQPPAFISRPYYEPLPIQHAVPVKPDYERQYFGVANLWGQQFSQTPCPNATCPTCPATNSTCPAPCPGTTNTAILTPIVISTTTDCSVVSALYGTTSFAKCARSTAAPSGSFSVSYAVASTAPTSPATYPTATISIVPTCPNTKVQLTCGAIPSPYFVYTQTQAVGSTSTVTETGAMQVIIAPNAASAPVTTISCNWVSLP